MPDLLVGCPKQPLEPINTVLLVSFSVYAYGYSKSVLYLFICPLSEFKNTH